MIYFRFTKKSQISWTAFFGKVTISGLKLGFYNPVPEKFWDHEMPSSSSYSQSNQNLERRTGRMDCLHLKDCFVSSLEQSGFSESIPTYSLRNLPETVIKIEKCDSKKTNQCLMGRMYSSSVLCLWIHVNFYHISKGRFRVVLMKKSKFN